MADHFTDPELSIQVSAPGKLVLWGEYAVLAGAPAGVLAVDRYTTCHYRSTDAPANSMSPTWQLHTSGFTSNDLALNAGWFRADPPPADHPGLMLWHAARELRWTPDTSAQLHINSAPFYQGGQKLGLGSSAATCTALYVLCAHLQQQPTNVQQALNVHKNAQQGAGSGIDVAASYLGGLVHFQLPPDEKAKAVAAAWPSDLHWLAIWTGQSASTTNHLKRFAQWRSTDSSTALDDLCVASSACSGALNLTTLANYVQALRRFDTASGVGIYTKGHGNLHKLAHRSGVIYKPCGAGGGDLGVAFATDPAQLRAFAAQAQAIDMAEIRLEMARHGVTIRGRNHQSHP